MQALLTIWIAVLGLSIGSFINVVIGRLPEDDDVDEPDVGDSWWEGWKQTFRVSGRAYRRLAWPPSRCPKCGHPLRWYENLPVVSWLALRGKCSSCKQPISPRYLIVELLTGTLFVCAFARFGWGLELAAAAVFLLFLLPLVFIDADLWILPFELTLPGTLAGLVFAFFLPEPAFHDAVWGAIGGFLAFRVMEIFGFLATARRLPDAKGLVRWRGLEALGAGDKYLLAMLGAFLGWRALLGIILLSSVQGAVIGIIRLKLTGSAGPTDEKEAPEAETEEEEDGGPERFPFTPSFLAPGLPLWKRVVLVPLTILFQDIPDSPPPDEETGEVPDWEPHTTNMPFGPWLGLAGVEILLLGPWLAGQLLHTPFRLLAEIAFGQ